MNAIAQLEVTHQPRTLPTVDRYISGLEGGAELLQELIRLALDIKANPDRYVQARPLEGKVFTALFLNPSLRTRTSFEAAMARLGGHMVALTPGSSSWNLEFDTGVVMDGGAAEHIIEAAGVLSSYSDAIGMRAFAPMQDFMSDMDDAPIHQLAHHAAVPVLSLESACYHPCQGLADAMTLTELFEGTPQGQPFTLTWTRHPKMCGVAVPHSAMLAAARLGMNVTVAHPQGYELHPDVVAQARTLAQVQGGSLRFTHDMHEGCRGARVIYAKAWGAPDDYGNPAAGAARNASHPDWTVREDHMALGHNPWFMHCLPVRRNVVVADGVLDSERSVVQQQAANRMWGQMALLLKAMLNWQLT
ncbi:MAG: N-acetylornithine carbamoyltransferase [Myxococcota bacterium]